jgi:hypothetical protein
MRKGQIDAVRPPKLFQILPFGMLLLFMAYIVFSFLVGYIPSTIIYLGIMFYILGVRAIWQLIIIPIGLALATYYLFQTLLDIYLPVGSLF